MWWRHVGQHRVHACSRLALHWQQAPHNTLVGKVGWGPNAYLWLVHPSPPPPETLCPRALIIRLAHHTPCAALCQERLSHADACRVRGVQLAQHVCEARDEPHELVVAHVIVAVLDVIPSHDGQLSRIVFALPIQKIDLLEQLGLMVLELSAVWSCGGAWRSGSRDGGNTAKGMLLWHEHT